MHIAMKCLNEQHSVKRCIKDFHDCSWVTDIVVIDGGSSDYTVQELKQFSKVKVFVHPYLDWYHDQEIMQANIMMSYVPNGSIFFSLDFDERCTSNLKSFLEAVDRSNTLPNGADLVHIPRLTLEVFRHKDSPFAILGEDGWPIEKNQTGQYPDYQPRLFRKSHKLHWCQSPHRVPLGYEKIHNVEDIGVYIEHFAKDDSRDRDWIEKRWLRPLATRKALGLPSDLYDFQIKSDYAEAVDPNYWKDR
jgi:glycosyltransferase involved in cell wall biosynthesis